MPENWAAKNVSLIEAGLIAGEWFGYARNAQYPLGPRDSWPDTVSRPARLHFDGPPAALRALNGIEIDFIAGFGEAGTDVPDLLRRAIVLLVAHWYEFRSSYGPNDQPVSYPDGYDRIVASYRTRRL